MPLQSRLDHTRRNTDHRGNKLLKETILFFFNNIKQISLHSKNDIAAQKHKKQNALAQMHTQKKKVVKNSKHHFPQNFQMTFSG